MPIAVMPFDEYSLGRDVYGLKEAAVRGDVARCRAALEAGADVHVDKDAALITAVQHGQAAIVLLLLQYGADPKARNNTPVQLAINYGYKIIGRQLVQYGADIGSLASWQLSQLQLTNRDLKGAAKRLFSGQDPTT